MDTFIFLFCFSQCAHMSSRIAIYYTMILLIVPFLLNGAVALYRHSPLMSLVPPWVERFLAVELLVKRCISLVLFAGAVPWLFSEIDKRSRRLAKPRNKVRLDWRKWFSLENKA
jgi:hypothetical protein